LPVSWAAPDIDERVADVSKLEALVDLLQRLETEASLLGGSPPLLGVS